MFCHKCGFELPEGSRFCPNCGVPVPELGAPAAPEKPAQPSEIPPSEEKAELVSERPSQLAARPGRLWRAVRVITMVFTGLLAAVLIFVILTLLGVVPPLTNWQESTDSTALLNGAVFGIPSSRTPETQPVFITYQDKSGQSFTANAFPGEVWMAVAQKTSPEKVESLITSNGGTLYGAIPSVGFYWASVPAGGEADFIAAMNRSSLVLKATPNEVLSLGQGGELPPDVTDFEDWVNKFAWEPEIALPIDNANLIQFDDFRNPLAKRGACSRVTHGDAVAGIAGKDGVLVRKFNIVNATGVLEPSLPTWAIISAGMAAEQQDRKLVLNFSFGTGPRDFVDRHACTKGSTLKKCNYYTDAKGKVRKWSYESMEQVQMDWFEKIAMVLDAMRTIVPSQFDRIAVVLSSGNSGLELTDEITYLRKNYPEAFKHMVIVGGTDLEGARGGGVSSSENPDDMLYAPAEYIEAPPDSGCRMSGTSVSAPKVSNILARLAADQSLGDLTMGQLIDSMFDAAPLTDSYKNVPEFAKARGNALARIKGKSTEVQTWRIVSEGQTAVITVDGQGNFSGSGWVSRTPEGEYPMPITSGRMSGTSITFQFSGSWDSKGLTSGSGSGTLNAPFPSATSASGSISGTSSHPNMGTSTFNNPWTATRVK